MTKLSPSFIGGLLLCLVVLAPSTGMGASPDDLSDQRRSEQKHFLECLAAVYSPAFWFSYNDSLYFQTKNEAQAHQLEAMKAARSKYLVLTNREARYELAAKGIAASGVGESWQRKILLPFSTTNQDLTPTLGRPLRILPRFKVLQSLAGGDALLQDDHAIYFVLDFGRGAEHCASFPDSRCFSLWLGVTRCCRMITPFTSCWILAAGQNTAHPSQIQGASVSGWG